MADLADMQNLSKWNNGFNYLLVIVDSFSKKWYVLPVKNKGAEAMRKAFVEVYANTI